MSNSHKVIVIGIDGATFPIFEEWMNEGQLPTLERLFSHGAFAVRKVARWRNLPLSVAYYLCQTDFDGLRALRRAYFDGFYENGLNAEASERLRIVCNQSIEAVRPGNIVAGEHLSASHVHRYYRVALWHRQGDSPGAERVSDRTGSGLPQGKLAEPHAEPVSEAGTKVVGSHRR